MTELADPSVVAQAVGWGIHWVAHLAVELVAGRVARWVVRYRDW